MGLQNANGNELHGFGIWLFAFGKILEQFWKFFEGVCTNPGSNYSTVCEISFCTVVNCCSFPFLILFVIKYDISKDFNIFLSFSNEVTPF